MFVRESTYEKAKAEAFAWKAAYTSLYRKWEDLVDKINAKGGQQFLDRATLQPMPLIPFTKDEIKRLAEFPGSAQSQTVDELRDDPPLARMIEKFARHIEAELSRASATALEPAATVSRTVSEQELRDWFAKHVIDADTSTEESGLRVEEVVRYRDLRKLLDRLIPAPSVAEPAKCGTCGYDKTVDGSFMHGGERQEKRMACPDCTPASAEQKWSCTCKCETKIIRCSKPFRAQSERPDACANEVEDGARTCDHSRTCHKEDGKQ